MINNFLQQVTYLNLLFISFLIFSDAIHVEQNNFRATALTVYSVEQNKTNNPCRATCRVAKFVTPCFQRE